jgi:signal transduction histidine kinase
MAGRTHRTWWLLADGVLAGLFTWITVVSLQSPAYVDQYGAVEGLGWLLALSPNALLLIRRLVPVPALLMATALYLVASATQGDSNAPLAIPFFAYSVAVALPVRVSAILVGGSALAMSTTTFYGPGDPDLLVIVVWFLLYGLGWMTGVSIRANRQRADDLTHTVDDLEARQDAVATAAIAEERARIARELHDAVGHAVNVIVLQAGAARLSKQPDKAFAALREIEAVGRDALTDLDQMLGLLQDERVSDRSPARTISDIAAMVDGLRKAGASIDLHESCDASVARHVGSAAYRIVQEALTNAVKHAPDGHIHVAISCTATSLQIQVVDDGGRKTAQPTAAGGRGIVGMTERAKVLGGQLHAGPTPSGGFEVRATLPLGRVSQMSAQT